MGHCKGTTTGPWYIGSEGIKGVTHSVPGYEDAENDIVLAMMKWVEFGKASSHLMTTKFLNDDASLEIQSQRPPCVYPKQATYVSGDPNLPESWKCKSRYQLNQIGNQLLVVYARICINFRV